MKQANLKQLLQEADREHAGPQRVGVCFQLSDAEHALLRETAWKRRTSQAGVLRLGLRLAAQAVADQERR